jgi:hypothetical protein
MTPCPPSGRRVRAERVRSRKSNRKVRSIHIGAERDLVRTPQDLRTLATTVRSAWKELKALVCPAAKEKAPVVFDIDDTLILPHSERLIHAVVRLYRKCLAAGFPVYIVTARPDYPENVESTKRMLTRKRLDGYKDLFFMPAGTKGVWDYKYQRRLHIAGIHNAPVAMTVGDQPWDVLPGWCGSDSMHKIRDGGIVHHQRAPNTFGVMLPPPRSYDSGC